MVYMYEETGENNTVNLKKILFFHWLNLDWFTFFVVNDILDRQVNFNKQILLVKGRNIKYEFSE